MKRIHLPIIFLILILFPAFLGAQIIVKTSDQTVVKDGDTILPIGFQGVHLISSLEYRGITVSGVSIVNTVVINGDPDFSINTADSGLSLWEKKPLLVKDQKITGSFEFHLDYCPLSGGERAATVSIGYDNGKTFKFTVKGPGRPEEFKLSSNADMSMNKVWGG